MKTLFITPIAHTTLDVYTNETTEDFYTIFNDGHKNEYEPTNIKRLKEQIEFLEQKGSTHTTMEYNPDHDEYELWGYLIREATPEEIEKEKQTDIDFQINYIKNAIKKIDDQKDDYEKALKRLMGQ